MGLRQALNRLRGVDEDGRRRDKRADETAFRRHQADPATGELVRADDDPFRYYTPPAGQAPPSAGVPFRQAPAPDDRPRPGAAARPEPSPRLAGDLGDGATADTGTPVAASGLVVGRAERRQAPVELPNVYSATPRPYDRSLVREAWELIGGRTDVLVRNFYAELFLALGSEAFQMFPASMAAQREDFGRTLLQWVVEDNPEAMTAHLTQLGVDHRKFEVEPRHYDVAEMALVNAWRGLLHDNWTPQIEDAVRASYTRLATTMIEGAMAHRAQPASWGATVVAHDRVLDDFAVLRIQPDAPYAYVPGQYLTVELESRPNEWRQMSIASAPRPDNTLDFHVRSVNATGVSASLVMHTDVGDRVRLGPPRGNDLVIEPGTLTPGGLLCVCSGTGAAPISAVVESIMAWPDCPPVHVFVGARRAADLYPADLLFRTVQQSGRGDRVHVHGVVSDDPVYTGLRGRVEDVVPSLKDWAQLGVDVLVSGSNAMMATTVDGLVRRGMHPARIHFDQYDAG